MKPTDSVIREFDERFALKYPSGNALTANYDEMKDFISHSLAEARRESNEQAYLLSEISGFLLGISTELGKRRQKIALEYCKELEKISDNMLFTPKKKDLLTGDNPENECKVCHRTSDVVDMSKCPFCEHDQELIREGRAMSDRDTRRGI